MTKAELEFYEAVTHAIRAIAQAQEEQVKMLRDIRNSLENELRELRYAVKHDRKRWVKDMKLFVYNTNNKLTNILSGITDIKHAKLQLKTLRKRDRQKFVYAVYYARHSAWYKKNYLYIYDALYRGGESKASNSACDYIICRIGDYEIYTEYEYSEDFPFTPENEKKIFKILKEDFLRQAEQLGYTEDDFEFC